LKLLAAAQQGKRSLALAASCLIRLRRCLDPNQTILFAQFIGDAFGFVGTSASPHQPNTAAAIAGVDKVMMVVAGDLWAVVKRLARLRHAHQETASQRQNAQQPSTGFHRRRPMKIECERNIDPQLA
jgi:hypothetical protein